MHIILMFPIRLSDYLAVGLTIGSRSMYILISIHIISTSDDIIFGKLNIYSFLFFNLDFRLFASFVH